MGSTGSAPSGLKRPADEVEDAVLARLGAGREAGPGDRRLRRIGRAQRPIRAPFVRGGELGERRQLAFGDPAIEPARIDAVEAEDRPAGRAARAAPSASARRPAGRAGSRRTSRSRFARLQPVTEQPRARARRADGECAGGVRSLRRRQNMQAARCRSNVGLARAMPLSCARDDRARQVADYTLARRRVAARCSCAPPLALRRSPRHKAGAGDPSSESDDRRPR